MHNKRHNLPKKIFHGKTAKSQPAKIENSGSGGKIATNLPEIRWTPTKLSLASAIILAPISFGIVICFKAGNILIGLILIGLILFMGLIYLALRYIENNEF
ncbi:MAG: hypothetical protein AAFN00_05815 [Cyanobacteria bacterium J06558_2]